MVWYAIGVDWSRSADISLLWSQCLSPIGEYNLRLGILKVVKPDLVATFREEYVVGPPFSAILHSFLLFPFNSGVNSALK